MVAEEGPYLAALHTELTPELVHEGLAREFVRHVQELRKQAEFDIAERIHLHYQASPKLAEAINAHRETIMAEILAVTLRESAEPLEGVRQETEFDGEQVDFTIARR